MRGGRDSVREGSDMIGGRSLEIVTSASASGLGDGRTACAVGFKAVDD